MTGLNSGAGGNKASEKFTVVIGKIERSTGVSQGIHKWTRKVDGSRRRCRETLRALDSGAQRKSEEDAARRLEECQRSGAYCVLVDQPGLREMHWATKGANDVGGTRKARKCILPPPKEPYLKGKKKYGAEEKGQRGTRKGKRCPKEDALHRRTNREKWKKGKNPLEEGEQPKMRGGKGQEIPGKRKIPPSKRLKKTTTPEFLRENR